MEAAPAIPDTSDQFVCPICERTCKPKKTRKLFDVRVCRKCSNAFVNRRQGAYILDWLLLYLLAFVEGAALALMFPEMFDAAHEDTLELNLFWIFNSWVFLPLLFCFKDGFNGYSPGKWLCGIRVVDWNSREPIRMAQSFKRNLILMIPFLPLVVALQLIKGVRSGDKWAKTCVIWKKYAHRMPFDPRGIVCTQCGYDLTGNESGRCPECGKNIPVRTHAAAVPVIA